MATAAAYDLDLLTRRFKALSDPLRLRILDRLRGGERCVCELTEALDAGQSLLSFHLKTLKDAGLVRDRRDGRWIHYSLNRETFDAIHGFIASFRGAPGAAEGPACCRK